jgi:Uma2 family endonuclease
MRNGKTNDRMWSVCDMATLLDISTEWTLADLQNYLDGIPAHRIRLRPWPGTATVQDAVHMDGHYDRLCELIDGVLVEKAMGFEESWIAANLLFFLGQFLQQYPLGIVTGADGLIQLLPHQVRIPDVAFFAWDRLPGRRLPREAVPHIVPDLAVEVLSTGNTSNEMRRKLGEYIEAGVRLVWYLNPVSRTVTVYRNANDSVELNEDQMLTAGDVLPGFEVSVRLLFTPSEAPQ